MANDPYDVLACPSCYGTLDVRRAESVTICTSCGARFPFSGSYPSFLVPRYTNFFEGQWEHWVKGKIGSNRPYGLTSEERYRGIVEHLGIDESTLPRKRILDAGTG